MSIPDEATQSGGRPTAQLVLRGVGDALVLPAWVLGLSFFAVGSLAGELGFALGPTLLATVIIWAGPAQVILFGAIAAGTALPAVALAIALSSIRLLPMAMTILPLLRTRSTALQLLIAHFVAVTVWVEGARRLPTMPIEHRLPYYFGFTNACLAVCMITTIFGFRLVGALPTPLAAGLLFMTPLFFTLSLCAGARAASDWAAIGLGFVLAPVFTETIGKDFDLLATGLIGGTAAYALQRTWKRA
jgi:predicted branched-subunit amino acid permease